MGGLHDRIFSLLFSCSGQPAAINGQLLGGIKAIQ